MCHSCISTFTILTASGVFSIDQESEGQRQKCVTLESDFNVLPLILFFVACKPNFS